MDLKTFLENFDAIAEAPGGIPKLRSLILDLAVRGKLVPQNPEDVPASVLLDKIKFVKEGLIQEKKIKRDKPLSKIEVDEIPYQIPQTWEWVRLIDVFDVRDGTHDSPKYLTTGIPFITSKNLYGGVLDLTNVKYISEEDHQKFSERSKVDKFDIIFAMIGSIGNPVIVDNDFEFSIKNLALFKYYSLHLSEPKFLYRFLSYASLNMQKQSLGGVQSFVSLSYLRKYLFPLPPLAEQKRIVEKVDELMGLSDRYEASKETRDNLRQKLRGSAIAFLMNAETDEDLYTAWAIVRDNWQRFSQHPEDIKDLRQSVFELAVRGKLVPQNFEEEPALVLLEKVETEKKLLIKEKKLKERWNPVPVSPDAIPYKIPMNWKWIRILDGVERVTVGHVGSMQNEYVSEGVPFLRSQNVRENRFDPLGLKFVSQEFHDKLAKSKLSPGDVVVVRSGNVGTTCVIPEALKDANCSDLVIVKRPMAIHSGFLSYYMNSAAKSHVKDGTVGIALTHFNTESVASLPIPLPPLAEQKRIVAKVDELMQLCDQLEASLRQSQQGAESLAASAISHLKI